VSIRETILREIERVAQEQNKKISALTDSSGLMDSGLDSLCFAVVVVRLEDELGLDPFSDTENTSHPVTFGDLVRIYENASEV